MTTPTIPSPAAIPGAGLSRAELLRRQQTADGAVAELLAPGGGELTPAEAMAPLAPPGELERLAAEQGVEPVTDLDDLAAPLRDRLTDDEFDAFQAAIRDRNAPTPTAPHPAALMPPHRATMPVIHRDQHIRRLGLELAVRFFQDLEVEPGEVLTTAKTWAAWIRSGTELVSDTTTPDGQPGRP